MATPIDIIDSGYTGPSASERCKGWYATYPWSWKPKSAATRAKMLAPHFPGVDFSHVETLAERYCVNIPAADSPEGGYRDAPKNGRKLVLHKHADGGLLVFPKPSVVVAKCIRKPTKGWPVHNLVMKYILGVFAELYPTFTDWTEGTIGPEYERLLERAQKMLAMLEREIPGDVLVLPFQAGELFVGYNMQSARSLMEALKVHVPATDFMAFCRAISDPESFADRTLFMDCPGVERASCMGGEFSFAPHLYVGEERFGFGSRDVRNCSSYSGSASLVLPVDLLGVS